MIKINNKGFLLTEAIVVAVFVMGMFAYLAINIFPLITKYDKALNYDNPNEVYNINVLIDNNYFFIDAVAKSTSEAEISIIVKFMKDQSSVKCRLKAIQEGVSLDKKCDILFTGDENDVMDDLTGIINYSNHLCYDYLNIDQLLFYKGNADDKLVDSLDRNMREYYNYTLNNKYDGVTIIARFNYGNDNYKFASIKWEE